MWLPFPVGELGEVPDDLRYEVYDGDGDLPPGQEEVELWVTPYRFSAADGELVAKLPNLKVLQTLSAGIEHIQKWVPDHVTLCNGRGIHDTATAELAVTSPSPACVRSPSSCATRSVRPGTRPSAGPWPRRRC